MNLVKDQIKIKLVFNIKVFFNEEFKKKIDAEISSNNHKKENPSTCYLRKYKMIGYSGFYTIEEILNESIKKCSKV